MQYVYVVCAVVGWGLVAFQLIAGHGGHDAHLGGDLHGDAGHDVGHDVGHDAEAGGPVSHILQFLRFSSLVFFLAFFGTAGLVFGLLDASPGVGLVAAVIVGLAVAVLNSAAYRFMRRGESSSELLDSDLVGRRAKVVVPVSGSRPGRVMVDVAGRPMRLPARPHPVGDRVFDVGADVLVVSFEGGTAFVDVLDPDLS
ncbi:MAG: hypothetical protein IT198_01605 [Acidimicrobiia bacterium]|nr:hypothetical protein [Acidimicrobiia bacterium]